MQLGRIEVLVAQHHKKDGVIARGKRAFFLIQYVERDIDIELRQRQQAATRVERYQDRQRRACNVEEWPDAEIAILRLDIHAAGHGISIGQHVVMTEHDPFGK